MNIRYTKLILLLFIFAEIATGQTVYYVDGSVSSSGSGTSWNLAFKTVQEGIDAASASLTTPSTETAEVWVKEGTYYVYVNSNSNTINMAEGVMIYGGFNGTEANLNQRNWKTNITILDGHQYEGSSNKVKHVVTAFGEQVSIDTYYGWSNGLIDGFTITGGAIAVGTTSAKEHNPTGFLKSATASASATDPSSILSSAYNSAGAGILIFKCGPNVSNCTITNNTSVKGGGMYIVTATELPVNSDRPKPEIYNCVISNNSATARGGGISLDLGSEPKFINCKIQNNSCDAKGGGAYIDWGCPEPKFINCLFTGNSAARAGALGADGTSSPIMINCTITDNYSEDVGAGLYTGSYNPDNSSNNDPVLINCIVYGNSTEWGGPADLRIWHEDYFWTSHCVIGEGFTAYGTGVINQDPLLNDISSGDYTLSTSSPCINTGTSSDALDVYSLIPDYDIDGNSRDSNPDMGCYEYSNITQKTDVNKKENEVTVYPNPTYGYIYMKGITTTSGNMKAELYDVTGSLLNSYRLNNGYKLNISTYPSGIYLLKLSGDNVNKTIQVVKQ